MCSRGMRGLPLFAGDVGLPCGRAVAATGTFSSPRVADVVSQARLLPSRYFARVAGVVLGRRWRAPALADRLTVFRVLRPGVS